MRKAIIGIVFLVAVSCGGSQAPTTSASTPTSPATIGIANDARLGQFLVDGSGRTLYLFKQDKSTTSTCYGPCAQFWPPLLTNGAPHAGSGVNAGLIGTSKRTDGSFEVTYGGHPLYYVVTDHNPGDTTGQGVNNFGAPWDVVGPDGKAIG